MKIRDYQCFCKVMAVATCDLYRIMFVTGWNEAHRRLRLLQIDNPELYQEWLNDWKRGIKP